MWSIGEIRNHLNCRATRAFSKSRPINSELHDSQVETSRQLEDNISATYQRVSSSLPLSRRTHCICPRHYSTPRLGTRRVPRPAAVVEHGVREAYSLHLSATQHVAPCIARPLALAQAGTHPINNTSRDTSRFPSVCLLHMKSPYRVGDLCEQDTRDQPRRCGGNVIFQA